jgi:hypothetical protein
MKDFSSEEASATAYDWFKCSTPSSPNQLYSIRPDGASIGFG